MNICHNKSTETNREDKSKLGSSNPILQNIDPQPTSCNPILLK